MSSEAGQWLFDLGNSRLKFAPLLADGRVGEITAIPNDEWQDAPMDARWPRGEEACVASVASDALQQALLAALGQRFERVSIARTQSQLGGMRIAYATPEHLGVDRFLALLAAHARGRAALVVGVGTALTIDLIDAEGLHRGGRIAPSPELMRSALHARVSQLPPDGGDYVEFAAGTTDALASGCEGAALALVERSLRRAEVELGVAPDLLVHGGGSGFLHTMLADAEPAPALVLRGLAQWASRRE